MRPLSALAVGGDGRRSAPSLSGFFIVATNAWMQHPVGYQVVNGRAELTSLWALLTNPYAALAVPARDLGLDRRLASMVMAGHRRVLPAGEARRGVRAACSCAWA